jgi:hypothetical protein
MKKQSSKIISRFFSYQKERFPMIILAFSLFPALLSSGVVVSSHPSIFKAIMALIASIAYLLHIRIIDEHRDFDHDNTHHIGRPVQAGLISRKELKEIDVLAISTLLGVAILSGRYAILLVIIMLSYSYFAGKEFFLGEKVRQHFFIYNSINLVQMLLMQLFIYTIFIEVFSFNQIVLAHFLFTTVGTIIFEFVRKLKIPGDDGTGKDTYTWHLGFNNSIIIYIILVLTNIFLFFRVIILISTKPSIWLIFCGFLATMAMLFAVIHWMKRKQLTDRLLQLSFLLSYGILNLIIYFIKL